MYFVLGVVALLILILSYFNQAKFGRLPSGKSKQRILKSKNFNGEKFVNLEKTSMMSNMTLKRLIRGYSNKPKDITPNKELPLVKNDLKIIDKDNYFVWFGHSSYLVVVDNIKYLVDPVFSGNVSPLLTKVLAYKGTDYYKSNDMPYIDYLIISHDHYDHLDYKTIVELKDKVNKVIVPLGVSAHFEHWGYDTNIITELDWYEDVQIADGIKITATPARHSSGRFIRQNRSLWASYVLESNAKRIFFGGDSSYGSHFKTINSKFGNFDFAFMESGQYNEMWRYSHMLPDEILKSAEDLGVKSFIPVHNSKFSLALHSWNEPLKEVTRINKEKYNFNILTPRIGEIVSLDSNASEFTNWFE